MTFFDTPNARSAAARSPEQHLLPLRRRPASVPLYCLMGESIMKSNELPALRRAWNERGSLALEQVLFIGAVVAMGAGVLTFYTNLGNYFGGVQLPTPPLVTSGAGAGSVP
jgi:hypothetical protein